MRKILTLTMSGLVTVLPLALTAYVIWWLVHTVEEWLRRALIALKIVSPEHYWPGLGLIAVFCCCWRSAAWSMPTPAGYSWAIGTISSAAFRSSRPCTADLETWSACCRPAAAERDLQRVVVARFGEVHAVGFVTREDVPSVLFAHGGHDWVTVYFPMATVRRLYAVRAPRSRPGVGHLGRGCDAACHHRGSHRPGGRPRSV